MECNEAAAMFTVKNLIQALGRGFDVNNDTRLLFCKGVSGSTVVEIDEERTRDLSVLDGIVVPNVSWDIRCLPDTAVRESTGVRTFDQMAEYFNQKALLSGNIPLGSFNSAFSFTGSKQADASSTKHLAMDGVVIPLCKIILTKYPLCLHGDVRRAVPTSWEPSSLASFIENYGTHIITSVAIGGKDVIYVKQQSSSPLTIMDLKSYIQEIGDQRFSFTENQTRTDPMKFKDKDVTVIFRRRGGNDFVQGHFEWKQTVREAPDVIDMTFCPITSLLNGIPGKDHLTRAISLYLEFKPPIEELRYFLEFQTPRVWSPIRGEIPGQQRKEPVCPSLQFSMMSPKLYVSVEQVAIGRRPITGLRLALEGAKQNRLCIHVQHLVLLPKILQPHWDAGVPIGAPKWHGPEEQDSRWFEPVKWKNFSYVSTAPIEKHEAVIGDLSGVHVVTGAQLGVWDFATKSVLYMRFLYSKLPNCTIRRSFWDHNPTPSVGSKPEDPILSSDPSSSTKDQTSKLMKHVDTSEMVKGPQDSPGHWLVTGGKLGVDKGRIFLRVKYSLLNY